MTQTGGGDNGVVASVLATTGELARVAGPGLRPHIGEVMPLIIEAIQDTAGGNKRLTAVSTLGQVLPYCWKCILFLFTVE
jgi:FKBP12-rapamycin complex-associated protein